MIQAKPQLFSWDDVLTVFCDRCNRKGPASIAFYSKYDSVGHRRQIQESAIKRARQAAMLNGWQYSGGKDLCPTCKKEAQE